MLERILYFCLLGVVVFVPLPFESNRPMYWGITETATFLLFCIWCLKASWREVAAVLRIARWPILVLACVCILETMQATGVADIRSIDVHATWAQLGKSLSYLFIFVLTITLVGSRKRVRGILWALLLSGTFQAVYGILGSVHSGQSATGTFVNRDHLAGYLEMTLSVGIGLLIADLNRTTPSNWRQSIRRWISVILGPKSIIRICLALMVIALIMTHSRMGNTAFFVSMMLSAAAGLLLFRTRNRGIIMLFSSMIVIDTLLMGTYFGLDKLQARIEQTNFKASDRRILNGRGLDLLENSLRARVKAALASHTNGPTVSERTLVPVHTAEARVRSQVARPRPASLSLNQILFGAGAGSYYTLFPQYRNSEFSAQMIHAHNDFLEFGLEFGVIGMGFFIVFITYAMVAAIRVQSQRRSGLLKATGFATMMATLAIAIHSTADFNLQIHANALTLVVILALPFAAGSLEDTRNKFQS